MSEVRRVTREIEGKAVTGYVTPTGKKLHATKERAAHLSRVGKAAALKRKTKKLIAGG